MNCPNCSRIYAGGSSKCICGYNFDKDAKDTQILEVKKNKDGGFFSPEKKGIQKGVMGGIGGNRAIYPKPPFLIFPTLFLISFILTLF